MEEQILTFIKGIDRNTSPRNVDPQSYYDALNAVHFSKDPTFSSLTVEKGTTDCLTLANGYQLLGSINTDTEDIVLFSTNNLSSEIGIFTPSCCKYTTVLNTSCLNFNTCNRITGVFKVRRGCERFIYFTDKVNTLKVINLDDINSYRDSLGNIDCSLMNITLPLFYPEVDIQAQNSGGRLELGAYEFAFRMVDGDGNYTNWSLPTTPIIITDNAINEEWWNIDGGQNIEFYTAEEGGVPKTNKSIKITFSNIDVRYENIEIAVLKAVSGLNTFSLIEILQEVNIGGTTQTFTYTGNVSQSTSEITIQELIVDKDDIQVVGTIAQLDNSLWLGNIKTTDYNWAAFQREALNINITPEIKPINHLSPRNEGNCKNPKPFSYLAGEVYEFGIMYHFKNGVRSPVFHIAGPEATNTERDIIATWNPDMSFLVDENTFISDYAKTEAELLLFPNKSVVRNYEVCDISNRINTTEATFSYYENKNSNYPNTVDCDGLNVWGDLANKPIRHHKFPSRRVVPIYENETINVLGIKVSNITYPHPDIVGHSIVRAIREDENKTILDKGILSGTGLNTANDSARNYGPGTLIGNLELNDTTSRPAVLWSPRQLVDDSLIGGEYFNIESYYNADSYQKNNTYQTQGFFNGNIRIQTQVFNNLFQEMALPDLRCNINFDSSIIVGADSTQQPIENFNTPLINTINSDDAAFYHITNDSTFAPSVNTQWLVSLKQNIDVYSNLQNLVYIPITDNVIYSTNDYSIFTGGDTVIFPLTLSTIRNIDEGGFLDSSEFIGQSVQGYWVESEYNLGLRHQGTSPCNRYFKNAPELSSQAQNINDYFILQIAEETNGGDYTVKNLGDVCKEYYGYNKDFSKQNIEKPSYLLDRNYDYCSECLNHYPNRIYYSRRDDLESDSDSYRTFLVNSYRNLDVYGDTIIKLMTDKDNLYALTTSAAYHIPTKTQQLQTDENTVYIGTGDRLSVPPTKLVSVNYKYGGTTQEYSVVNSHFGIIYADEQSGKVFKLSDSLKEISNEGLTNFFEEHLPIKFNLAYRKLTGEDYWCKDSTVDTQGVGLSAVFDPRFKRYILHKKDYDFAEPFSKFRFIDDQTRDFTAIYVDPQRKKFFEISRFGAFTEIELTNPKYFKDVSWTISYSMELDKWISFHSYCPDIMFNNHETFFSANNNNVYTHNFGETRKYYGIKYPFFVETTINDKTIQNKIIDSFGITADSYSNDSYVSDIFNKYWLYTNKQSTGIVELTPFSDNAFQNIYSDDISLIREIKDKYYFNVVRNKLTQLPSFLEDIEHRIPNQINNYNSFERARIKGDWANLRLILDTNLDTDLHLHSLIVKHTNSNR